MSGATCATCQGRNRETTDMVCMTCGRDYLDDDPITPGLGWRRLMHAWRDQCKAAEAERDELRVELETERIELGEWKDSANANGAERAALAAAVTYAIEQAATGHHDPACVCSGCKATRVLRGALHVPDAAGACPACSFIHHRPTVCVQRVDGAE